MSEQSRTLVAVGLMGLILLVFFSDWYQELVAPGSTTRPKPNIESSFSGGNDSTITAPPAETLEVAESTFSATDTTSKVMKTYPETRVTVSTPLFEFELSNLGAGTLEKAYLNDYLMKDSSRVQLVSDQATGVLANSFMGYEVDNFETKDLAAGVSLGSASHYDVFIEDAPQSLYFTLELEGGAALVRTFTFYPDETAYLQIQEHAIGIIYLVMSFLVLGWFFTFLGQYRIKKVDKNN